MAGAACHTGLPNPTSPPHSLHEQAEEAGEAMRAGGDATYMPLCSMLEQRLRHELQLPAPLLEVLQLAHGDQDDDLHGMYEGMKGS